MKKEKKFKAKKGQTDYTNIRYAPVISCYLQYKNKILVVQRSAGMRIYPNYWNGIGGFLDDQKSIEEKVREELREETGISGKQITSIKVGQIFDDDAPEYKKTWIVHPVLVKVNTNKVKLDWEAQGYKWVTPKEALKLNLMPGAPKVLKALFG
jgi:8-oxo-dGTP pyrophosphatase MutT (NUDIX family)